MKSPRHHKRTVPSTYYLDYSILVRRTFNEDNYRYVATIPELPGVSALGHTRVLAVRAAQAAIVAAVRAHRIAGNTLPRPDIIGDVEVTFE